MDTVLAINIVLFLQRNSVDVEEWWTPGQLSFPHLGGLLAGFGKRYLRNSPYKMYNSDKTT